MSLRSPKLLVESTFWMLTINSAERNPQPILSLGAEPKVVSDVLHPWESYKPLAERLPSKRKQGSRTASHRPYLKLPTQTIINTCVGATDWLASQQARRRKLQSCHFPQTPQLGWERALKSETWEESYVFGILLKVWPNTALREVFGKHSEAHGPRLGRRVREDVDTLAMACDCGMELFSASVNQHLLTAQ